MRIWDVDPGYLNRQSLLGEHRELHGMVNVLTQGKKGYSRHPETLRWKGLGWALRQRHALLAAEMALRGYQDKSPVRTRSAPGHWPEDFIDPPHRQFLLLREKYLHRESGRIPLPRNVQQLWSQHKYSVMARDPGAYQRIGRAVARRGAYNMESLSLELIGILRQEPGQGGLTNALHHMWGYVARYYPQSCADLHQWSLSLLLRRIQQLAWEHQQTYLLHSTALGELSLYLK